MEPRCVGINKAIRERHYPKLHNALDRHLRMLRSYGIGVVEMERKLWSLGILGMSMPQALLNAVFFYNGKSFALRGVKEQLDLRFEQFIRMRDPDRYTYYEHGSKNHSGGVADKGHGKIVTIVDTAPHVSHVRILDMYLSKI